MTDHSPFAEGADHFIAAMAHAATGVSVVTTDGEAGRLAVTVTIASTGVQESVSS